jgi:ABC-type dipeptide/oligopeptide/nickel transport system permease component
VQDSDVSVVIGIVTMLAAVTIVVMIIVDLVYAALDPRIRFD